MYNRTSVCGIKINTESGLKNMAAEKQPPKHPEISIIVPVYKTEKYLNECIDSILAQTFTDFELILVDDGSPDGCPALCDAAAAKDSRIRVIHKPNGGVSTARNAGLDAACGNWIGFVDSDDVIDRTYYEKLYRAAKQSGAEIAASNILYANEDGTPHSYKDLPLKNEVLTIDEAAHRIRMTPLVQAATRLHRRDVIEHIHFPDGKNYEDAFTTPTIFENSTAVACVEEMLYHYRLHSSSIMHEKIGLKNLDEVGANYGLLQCALRHGKKDTAMLEYMIMKSYFRKTFKKLSRADRKNTQVQQTLDEIHKAEIEIKQAGADTLRNKLEAAVWFRSKKLYYRLKGWA